METNILQETVGIVIPSYNQCEFLEQTILSVLQQNVLKKIALVDGGSIDSSASIIEKYQNEFTYWRSYKDSGQASAINEGASKLYNCEFICWINSDDIYLLDGLVKMKNFLINNPEYDAIYGKAYVIDKCGKVIGSYPTKEFNKNQFSKECFICQPATLIRNSCWKELGGLNPNLFMCLDYDLWLRIINKGRIAYLEEYVACSRDHEETKTNNYQTQGFQEAFLILKRNYGYVPFNWILSYEYNKHFTKHKTKPKFWDKNRILFFSILRFLYYYKI